MSDQHEGRFLNQLLYLSQEFRTHCSIDHAMIAGKTKIETEPRQDLAINHHGLFHNAPDRNDGSLGWVDNGIE